MGESKPLCVTRCSKDILVPSVQASACMCVCKPSCCAYGQGARSDQELRVCREDQVVALQRVAPPPELKRWMCNINRSDVCRIFAIVSKIPLPMPTVALSGNSAKDQFGIPRQEQRGSHGAAGRALCIERGNPFRKLDKRRGANARNGPQDAAKQKQVVIGLMGGK